MAAPKTTNSMETILTFANRDASNWSVVWSTSHIPGMDNAAGGGNRRYIGRRRLRIGSLALCAFLTMHCRISASALTGGSILFMLFLVVAVAGLANPLRHFEIYLGQWSISGPGRAFRIIPMLDGIGIAICINAIVRAITYGTMAAICLIYVIHSVSDSQFPFTYCRDFDMKVYQPIVKDIKSSMLQDSRFLLRTFTFVDDDQFNDRFKSRHVDIDSHPWRNNTEMTHQLSRQLSKPTGKIEVCKETYSGVYPPAFRTPAYNFFYVEVMQLRPDYSFDTLNIPLVSSIVITWGILWMFLILERVFHGRLVWNNIPTWFVIVPWCWCALLLLCGLMSLASIQITLNKVFRVGAKELFSGVADALEVAIYIHSTSVGTELILGKGLNHYASGHIDSLLNSENVIHSVLLLVLCALHSSGAAICAIVDHMQPDAQEEYQMQESTLWILPMYSKCVSYGNYSHLVSSAIFAGLTFSYMTAAYMLLKTALHTIFEYKVKLVFIEQVVVATLLISCIGLSLPFATCGGIALLESVDAIMSGVAMPFVAFLELAALLYVYRSRDFISDMNIATEENACGSRIGTQWQIIPFVVLGTLIIKITALASSEMPVKFICYATVPLILVVIAVPIRACFNAYAFFRPGPRRGV